MQTTRRRGAALVALTTLAFGLWSSGSSASATDAARHVSCGTVVTRSLTLHSDVGPCRRNGLIIGANHVSIDLNGHSIRGDGVNPVNRADTGVLVAGHSGVRVARGSITGFQIGVLLSQSRHDRLDHLRVRDSSGKAIILSQAPDNIVARNVMTHSVDAGLGIFDGSDRTLVIHNRFRFDGGGGVENNFANGTVVTENDIRHTGSGIILESSNGLSITHNRIVHSPSTACDGCGIGIQIYGNHNLARDNLIFDAPRYGIEVDDFQDPGHSPARGNVLAHNTIIKSGLGIALGPEAGGVVLGTNVRGNRVALAIGDGIQALGPSTGLQTSTLTRNVAVHNGGSGIAVVPGTRDGGGNIAAGNGNPQQCLNITCN